MFGDVTWFRALSLLIGVFQRIVTKSFSSAVFGQSPYQFPFVSMFHIAAVFISHILDTSIARSLYLGSSSNSFSGPFMSDGMVMS